MDSNKRLTAFFTLFYFSSLLVFNVKSLLIVFILLFLILFFAFQLDLLHTSLISFILALPFENSIRQWVLYNPGAEILNSYTFFYGLSPKTVIFFLIILLGVYNRRKLKLTYSPTVFFLILFFIFVTLISLTFKDRYVFIYTGYLRIAMAAGFFFTGLYLATNSFSKILRPLFISLVLFNTIIGFSQLIHQQSLGRYMELTPIFSKTGYNTTDGQAQYRVSGLISHPTFFGSYMSILLPIYISISFTNPFFMILIPIFISVLIGTLSRSTWINMTFIFLLFFNYIQSKSTTINLRYIYTKFKTITIFSIVTIILLILPKLITRFYSLSDLVTNPNGSLYARLGINKNGILVASSSPLTGVGLNNFAYYSYIYGLSSNFSAPPHNTIIIFLAELGYPTTIIFILFLLSLLWPKSNPFSWPPLKFGIWIGLLTFIISSQFHPLFNLDPTFDFFMFCSGVFSVLCQTTANSKS